MESLTELQLAAVHEARRLLHDAGLTLPTFVDLSEPQSQDLPNAATTNELPQSVLYGYTYHSAVAKIFSREDRLNGRNRVNRQTRIDGLLQHPLNSVVEYPDSGDTMDTSIGHLFTVDTSLFFHPKLNIQYSFGDIHGRHDDTTCEFLRDKVSGDLVKCKGESISCKGLKICEAVINSVASIDASSHRTTPSEELFHRTLAIFCSLLEKGCAFDLKIDGSSIGIECLESEEESESEAIPEADDGLSIVSRDSRRQPNSRKRCRGKIEMARDRYGRPIIQCQKRKRIDPAHLIIRKLDEFDIAYLQALLTNDVAAIEAREKTAKENGYGPLMPCTFIASPSAQKQLCPYWHRFPDGKLRRGSLSRPQSCSARYMIYTPEDLVSCPNIFIVAKNPHSHPRPFPVKTPPPLLHTLSSLLIDMGWKLADATPRKIVIDSGFMNGLRRHLDWKHPLDPSLSDLHPSLGNLDHVRRIIEDLRSRVFPKGTGFEGAQLLADQEHDTPPDARYVRCAEAHILSDGKIFQLIICMSVKMSHYLMNSEYLSIDTSFKRLHHKWQEFEIESWDAVAKRSTVAARAFTTSQSAQAHSILFRRIFEIATLDTGIPVQFKYIHGRGFLVWIADAHKGQALGLGMFCRNLCANLSGYCQYEPSRLLRSLNEYDHLRRFFRLCVTHFMRHIHDLRVSREVKDAMTSLSSSEPLPDIEGVFSIIKSGGRKAQAWLTDKRVGSKFALPALYQPLSLIPYETWKASPSTTNGNEQSHRNIYRDGINLTVLAGIMRGMQYDARAANSLKLLKTHGIYSRDREETYFRRYERSLNRQGFVQRQIYSRQHGSERAIHGNDNAPFDSFPNIQPDIQPELENHAVADNFLPEDEITSESSHVAERPREETQPNFEGVNNIASLVGARTESTYSSLEGALDWQNASTAVSHRALSLQFQVPEFFNWLPSNGKMRTASVSSVSYNPDIHFSSFSTLHGALGDEHPVSIDH